jgi:hypothetical protein
MAYTRFVGSHTSPAPRSGRFTQAQTALFSEMELSGDARRFEQYYVYCRHRVSGSVEVYTGGEWRPCCTACRHEKLKNVARSLDQLREPDMLAFRMRALVPKRPNESSSDGQSQLALFREFRGEAG